MKKLLMTVAIVMAAVTVNAAAVTWMAAGSATTLSDGSVANGVIAYMFEGTLSASVLESIASRTWDASGSGAIAIKNAATNGGISQTGITKRADGTTGGYANETVDFSMVIFNTADYATATQYKYAEVKDVTFVTANKTANFGTSLNAGTWADIAPEPTSGLMMLLGMGVLALRRRRA